MPKKIYDILPPGAKKKTQQKEKVVVKKPRVKKQPVSQPDVENILPVVSPEFAPVMPEPEEQVLTIKKKFPVKEILVGCAVLLFVVFGYLYFKLQKVDIQIWPSTEVLSYKEVISADKSVQSINQDDNIIPAKIFTEQKDLWQDFPATGITSSQLKASGIIKVYNKYSPASPISLKAGTHFLSDTGKYFVSLEKITIPAATVKSGKITPGSVSVKVQAEEPGEDYNIKPAKFSVPKLVGTAYYYSVYGESLAAMTGGSLEKLKKVSDDDLQNAKETLTKKLLDDAKNSLKEKVGSEYVLIDSAILNEVIDSGSAVKAGAIVDNFNYQVKVKSTAVAFLKSDLDKFVNEYLSSKISQDRNILPNTLQINYNVEKIDITNGKMSVTVNFSVKDYKVIDKDDLISLIREKNALEIRDLITSRVDNPERVVVNFWPFWTNKAPKDKNKITLELKFQ